MKDAILQKSKLYDDDVAPDAAQSPPAWREWRQPCYPVERGEIRGLALHYPSLSPIAERRSPWSETGRARSRRALKPPQVARAALDEPAKSPRPNDSTKTEEPRRAFSEKRGSRLGAARRPRASYRRRVARPLRRLGRPPRRLTTTGRLLLPPPPRRPRTPPLASAAKLNGVFGERERREAARRRLSEARDEATGLATTTAGGDLTMLRLLSLRRRL